MPSIKEKLIVKIEISSLILCILWVEVGPTAHPVVAAVEGSDVAYSVETCPTCEGSGTEQWTAGDRSVTIGSYKTFPTVEVLVALLREEEGVAV